MVHAATRNENPCKKALRKHTQAKHDNKESKQNAMLFIESSSNHTKKRLQRARSLHHGAIIRKQNVIECKSSITTTSEVFKTAKSKMQSSNKNTSKRDKQSKRANI